MGKLAAKSLHIVESSSDLNIGRIVMPPEGLLYLVGYAVILHIAPKCSGFAEVQVRLQEKSEQGSVM